MPAWGQNVSKSVVQTERVRAELLAHAPDGVGPGRTVWLGLQLAHQPEWHTYWKNSGDSGLATQLAWELPAGVMAGDVAWPLPKKIPIGELANYGYEDTVLLPVPVTITPEFKAPLLGGDLPVKLKANWLVCKKECIPEEGEFTLKLPLQSSTAMHAGAFDAALAAQPRAVVVGAGDALRVEGSALKLSLQSLPAAWRGKPLEFFPETGEVIETGGAWSQAWSGGTWQASVPLSPQRSAAPSVMPVVLAQGGQGVRLELPVTGSWPAGATPAGMPPALQAALDKARAEAGSAGAARPAAGGGGAPITLWAALAGALVGGLILNLMPCVFPVLAIKLLGFAGHGQERARLRASGIAYSIGVVVSFLALGGAMLALRAAGEQLGWGFQLQSPGVVAALALLFTLIGLNLAGVFEFGNLLPSRLASAQARHPVADAFLSGVLAVAIASPCTAPFMGASLGLAVALPAGQALAVFAALGLGMALPYLAATFVPAVARALPRPGPWMDTFRKLMAFPMFATVAWLVWVLGQQSGIDGAGALLLLLVLAALLAWALTLSGRTRAWIATFSVAALATGAWLVGPNVLRLESAAPAVARVGSAWQPWEPGRTEQLLATGQPVFVDYTAAWCVTCQYNKRTTLADTELLADLARRNVALLRADWTRRDPAITAALDQLGRSGVPVYVLHAPGRAPIVLSEVISPADVRAALARI